MCTHASAASATGRATWRSVILLGRNEQKAVWASKCEERGGQRATYRPSDQERFDKRLPVDLGAFVGEEEDTLLDAKRAPVQVWVSGEYKYG